MSMAPEKRAMPSLASALVKIRGGMMRIVWLPAVANSNPLSLAYLIMGSGFLKNSTPSNKPSPRTSLIISGYSSCSALRSRMMAWLTSSTFLRKCGLVILSTTPNATVLDKGLPPNVVPWSPTDISVCQLESETYKDGLSELTYFDGFSYFVGGHQCANRYAIRQRFRHGENIGCTATVIVLMRPHFSAST